MPRNLTPGKGRGKQFISPTSNINEDRLNGLVHQYLDMGDVKSAVFWAEKKIALNTYNNNGNPTYLEIAKYLKVCLIHCLDLNGYNAQHFRFYISLKNGKCYQIMYNIVNYSINIYRLHSFM